jgi:hypothetical protein
LRANSKDGVISTMKKVVPGRNPAVFEQAQVCMTDLICEMIDLTENKMNQI